MEAQSKQNMCLLLMRACYYYRKSDDLIKKKEVMKQSLVFLMLSTSNIKNLTNIPPQTFP